MFMAGMVSLMQETTNTNTTVIIYVKLVSVLFRVGSAHFEFSENVICFPIRLCRIG